MTGSRAYGLKIGATLVVLVLLTCACLAWIVRADDDPDPPAAAPTPSRTQASALPKPTWSPVGPQVVMPNVVGRNAAVAAAELTALGFTNVLCVTPEEEDGFRPTAEWVVSGQSVAAGTTIPVGNGALYLRCERAREGP